MFYKTHCNIIVFFLTKPEKHTNTHKHKHTLCIYLYVYRAKSKNILKGIYCNSMPRKLCCGTW